MTADTKDSDDPRDKLDGYAEKIERNAKHLDSNVGNDASQTLRKKAYKLAEQVENDRYNERTLEIVEDIFEALQSDDLSHLFGGNTSSEASRAASEMLRVMNAARTAAEQAVDYDESSIEITGPPGDDE